MGSDHTCALADDGGVWCWGSNENGNLGVPTANYATSPVPLSKEAFAGEPVGPWLIIENNDFCASF